MPNSQNTTCPIHSTVPLMAYGGQQWCRFCAANKHRFLNQLQQWLVFCQWGLVLSLPLCLAALCVLTPVNMTVGLGQQDRAFWWYLLFPTAFAAAAAAISAGHLTIRAWDHFSGQTSGLVPWFHATHALRDWADLAILFSLLYAPILYFGRDFSFLSSPAETGRDWLVHRAPVLLAAAFFALILADKLRLITRDAVLPRSVKRNKYMLVYMMWMVIFYLYIQNHLAAFVMRVPGPSLFIVSVSFVSFFLLMYGVIHVFLRLESQKIGSARQGPIPATIALVGPSFAGKTVFLSRAYSLLHSVRGGMVILEPTTESKQIINPILEELEKNRDWPGGTMNASQIPFVLSYGMNEMVRFMWLDQPGRVFTDPDDPNVAGEVQEFERHLVNADAVAMIVDGEKLEQAVDGQGQMLNEHIYRDVARELYTNLKKVGAGARPVPLAVIVTKTCMVNEAAKRRFKEKLHELIINSWYLFADQNGLPQPAVKVFLSSAIITTQRDAKGNPIIPPKPEPLRAEQCVEPVLWLAAQTMRANMTLMDHASGFHGRSELQEYILRLESLTSR